MKRVVTGVVVCLFAVAVSGATVCAYPNSERPSCCPPGHCETAVKVQPCCENPEGRTADQALPNLDRVSKVSSVVQWLPLFPVKIACEQLPPGEQDKDPNRKESLYLLNEIFLI